MIKLKDILEIKLVPYKKTYFEGYLDDDDGEMEIYSIKTKIPPSTPQYFGGYIENYHPDVFNAEFILDQEDDEALKYELEEMDNLILYLNKCGIKYDKLNKDEDYVVIAFPSIYIDKND